MNAPTSGAAPTPTDGSGSHPLRLLAVGSGIALQAVVLVPFTVGSGLVAPWPAMAALYVLWLGMSGLLWVVARRWPLAAPLVPLTNAGLLFGVITFGASALGWTP
jgi:hypothetical protein